MMVRLMAGSGAELRLTFLDMLLEWRLQLEGLGAHFTSVWPGVRVGGQMVLKTGHLAEGLGANVAYEGLVAGVDSHVLSQDVLRLERLLADFTGVLGVAVATAVVAAEVAAVEGSRVG